jgi:hypothetical protein
MYFAAKAAQLRLEKPARRAAGRTDWEKVAQQYAALVARYPQSAYCDDALLRTGDLYRDMAERFRSQRDLAEAVRRYNQLVSQYPSSSLAEQALFSAFEIEHTRRGRRRAAVDDAARRYIGTSPLARGLLWCAWPCVAAPRPVPARLCPSRLRPGSPASSTCAPTLAPPRPVS